MKPITLFGRPGWGSAIIELQLAWYGIDYEFESVGHLFKEPEAREKLAKVNPLAQVPTLVMPDGSILTESAAITLLLAEQAGDDSLVPAPGSPERSAFLRWLVFIVANIYPTYTYADDPARFVAVPDAQEPFRKAVEAYACKLYLQLEGESGAPWFLGDRFSALDIYLAVLTNWGPKPRWFEEHAPKLHAAAQAAARHDRLKEAYERNFAAKAAPTSQSTT